MILVSLRARRRQHLRRRFHVSKRRRNRSARPGAAGLFRFLENRMWIDELYAGTVGRVQQIAFAFGRTGWIAISGTAWSARSADSASLFGIFTANFDERGINAGVDETTAGARGLGRVVSALHSGQIQIYLGVIAVGMLALLLLYAWLA